MAPVVIDLLSSPDLPPQKRWVGGSSGIGGRNGNGDGVGKGKEKEKDILDDDEWFKLSSEVDLGTPGRGVGKIVAKTNGASTKTTLQRKAGTERSTTVSSNKVSGHTSISTRTTSTNKINGTGNVNGVFYNESDFDSTVNFDDSYALGDKPAAKGSASAVTKNGSRTGSGSDNGKGKEKDAKGGDVFEIDLNSEDEKVERRNSNWKSGTSSSRPSFSKSNSSSKSTTTTKPSAPKSTSIGGKDPFDFSDDDDGEATRGPSKGPTSNSISNHMTTSKPLGPSSTSKGGKDFFYLSDSDTDGLDPFASSPPPAKKRALSSPPPKSKAMDLPKAKTTGAGYKRSISNIESSSSKHMGPPVSKKAKTILESDPILFTSSPDLVAEAAKRKKEKRLREIEEEEEESDGMFVGSGKGAKKAKTVAGFDFDNFDFSSDEDGKAKDDEDEEEEEEEDRTKDEDSDSSLPDICDIGKLPKSKSTSKSKAKSSQSALAKYKAEKEKGKAKEQAQREKEDKAKEKATAKERKEQEKIAAKERKEEEKRQKALDKLKNEALAKVNAKKTDKKVSSAEMIVHISSSISPKIAHPAKGVLETFGIEYREFESPLTIVKWQRKVQATYNAEQDIWEPCQPHIRAEDHVMCVLEAEKFVSLSTAAEGQDLDTYTLRLKTKFDSCQVIFLIQDLVPWMNKNRNLKNRQFAAAVRSHLDEKPAASGSSSQRPKKKKDEPVYVDENLIEDALLRLQIVHNALIHHVNQPGETANWISVFTQHISTIPYREQKDTLDTAFCMESGQVKSGDSPSDTYTKMLQEIMRVTAGIAYGIAAEYPDVWKLVDGLEKKGPLCLENCKKGTNKNGAFSDRNVGPAVSKKVHRVFLGREPGSFDV